MRWSALLVLAALMAAACSSGGGTSPAAAPSRSLPKAELPQGGKLKPGHVPKSAGLPTPGVGGHPIKAHRGHVTVVVSKGSAGICSFITRAQVDHVMGTALPAPRPVPVGTFDECAIFRHRVPAVGAAAIRVAWAVPPASAAAALFREHTINLPASDAVRGLGTKAYCSARSPTAQLFSLSGKWFLEVFADSCAHAVALARIALARL
jgi:hypothetical protein